MNKIRYNIESIEDDLIKLHTVKSSLIHIKKNIEQCLDKLEYSISPEYTKELGQKLDLIQANLDQVISNTENLENQLSKSIDKINNTKLMS